MANNKTEAQAEAQVAAIKKRRRSRIAILQSALKKVIVKCDSFHHSKKDQHKQGEPCPVEQEIREALYAKGTK